MEDEKRPGGSGLSRTPRTPGKLPRVSVSLSDELNEIIKKEALKRGITVSKYVSDVLSHMHDDAGLNIPEPMAGGQVDMVPVMQAINSLAGEVRTLAGDMHEMKQVIYALPAGNKRVQTTLFNEQEQVTEVTETAQHSAALEKTDENPVSEVVDQSAALEKPDEPVITETSDTPVKPETSEKPSAGDWITGGELKTMFSSEMTGRGYVFSKHLQKMRDAGELIGEERSKRHWFYDPVSVQRYFEKHPEHKRSAEHIV